MLPLPAAARSAGVGGGWPAPFAVGPGVLKAACDPPAKLVTGIRMQAVCTILPYTYRPNPCSWKSNAMFEL